MTPEAPIVRREPALVVGIVVGLVTGAAAFLSAWGAGQDWRVAAGAGLGVLATTIGGAAVVRAQVYSPASADTIMDAHAVIDAAERSGRG